MSEADQRQKVIQLLKPLHAISVENRDCHPGTPDVNYGGVYTFKQPNPLKKTSRPRAGVLVDPVYLEGWIELKWEAEWPKRGGPLRVPHYTQQQKIWARQRRYRGGACWLLLTVRRDWILLDGEVAATLPLGNATREELIEASVAHWDTPPDREEFIACLLLTGNDGSSCGSDEGSRRRRKPSDAVSRSTGSARTNDQAGNLWKGR